MADILEQSEVDALLAAVDSGAIKQPESDVAITSSNGAMSYVGGRTVAQVECQLYDFKRPERVSKEQMRALSALHEGFGRSYGASLSGFLRTIVDVKVAHLEQITYSEFIHSLPNPTCFNLLKSEQLDGQVCLEMSPLIIYPIIDRLLGGSNADLFIPQRPLTQIEQRLVERLTDRATHNLSEAWSALTPVTFKVHDFESNPQLVQIVPPNETVVVVGFELKIGARSGTMSLCIPYNVLEPIVSKLSSQTWLTYQKKTSDETGAKRVKKHVGGAPIQLRSVLAETTIRLSDLLTLKPGDVITTEKRIENPVTIEVEGKEKFTGSLGKFRGKKAVCVIEGTEPLLRERPTEAKPVPKPSGNAPAVNKPKPTQPKK